MVFSKQKWKIKMSDRENDLHNALKEIYTLCLVSAPCGSTTAGFYPDYEKWHIGVRKIAKKQLMKKYKGTRR